MSNPNAEKLGVLGSEVVENRKVGDLRWEEPGPGETLGLLLREGRRHASLSADTVSLSYCIF